MDLRDHERELSQIAADVASVNHRLAEWKLQTRGSATSG
jgi:hypothetical protein